jgi:hypothetical protein
MANSFVEFNGKPVASVKKGSRPGDPAHLAPYRRDLAYAARRADLEAAGFLGMSPKVLQETYRHHHPDYLQGAAALSAKKPGTFRWPKRWSA